MSTPIEKYINYENAFSRLELTHFEGASIGPQVEYFINLLDKNPQIKTILEIGFNTGRSAAYFLSSRDDIKVVSVDIGYHSYVNDCKKIIDSHFPGRHTLLIGDSKVVLPQLLMLEPRIPFDLIFIDGDHSEVGALADAKNCLALATKETIIVMDDTCLLTGWDGVLQAMCNLIKEKLIDWSNVHTVTDQKSQRAWTLFFKARDSV